MPSSLSRFAHMPATFRGEFKTAEVNVALLIRRGARRNLTVNGTNDTRFTWSGIYVAGNGLTTPIPQDGEYLSSKTGKMVRRENGPIVVPAEGVHVGIAADYGLYVEMDQPFLYPAMERVAGRQAEEVIGEVSTALYAGDVE